MDLNPEFVRTRHLEREQDAIHEQLGTPRGIGPSMESELLAMEAPPSRLPRWSVVFAERHRVARRVGDRRGYGRLACPALTVSRLSASDRLAPARRVPPRPSSARSDAASGTERRRTTAAGRAGAARYVGSDCPRFCTNWNPKRPLMQRCPLGHRRVERRRDLDDLVVLDVQRQRAADAAVRADRVGRRLRRLVPRAGRAHVVLGLEHQRAGRTDADAVAAVDAGRRRQRRVPLGRDAGVEAATRDGDRERVLRVRPARLDALVAEDAARVVAHVEVVVDLHRLRHRRRVVARRARGGGLPSRRRARPLSAGADAGP